jgi:ribosomal protein S1/(E)-4-hydroxy-3-methyl-but-2-enyl pyrophosphate reductase
VKIIKASTAGFCFGVSEAINKIYKLIEKNDKPIYTMGPVIHNNQMVGFLEQKGVGVINDINDAPEKGYIVIRAHGVKPEIYEDIRNNGHVIVDATCPYVKKIHDLVNSEYKKGSVILIIGNKNHPEVIGTNGWCEDSAYIIYSKEDIDMLPAFESSDLCVVAQTTITRGKWDELNNYLNKKYENIKKFDTICNTTSKMQKEALEIASNVDIMIVVGCRISSNTQKLYEICKKQCNNTYFIETPGDLKPVKINNNNKTIGLTAGASTPEWLIEEVIKAMEDANKNENEINFKDVFEESIVTLRSGEIRRGKIIGFNDTDVFVDMGYKSDGIIPIDEFESNPDFKPQDDINVGEEIDVYIKKVNDGEGNILLSKKTVDEQKNWDEFNRVYKDKTVIDVEVIRVVKGGVIARYSNQDIFIPASQIGERFIKDLNQYIGTVLQVKIIDMDRSKRKLVGSQKIVLTEQRKVKENELWNNIEEDKIYKGAVKSLTKFGAFVDIGGVDGLIHISELSWGKIKHPSEVVSKGDIVEVKVLEFDKEKKRISLGYRKQEDNPWYMAGEKYKVGDIVKGKVVRLVPFGVFVELEKGIDGLVHISQISNQRISKPADVLKMGQFVDAKIVEVDIEKNKIGLSIKEAEPVEVETEQKADTKDNEQQKNTENEHKEEMSVKIGDIINGNNSK